MAKSKKINKKTILLISLLVIIISTGGWYYIQSSDSSFSQKWAPGKQQNTDYMSKVLNRNWRPLGLLENPELKKYLAQPNIFWAIRSGERHILN
ncbi:MAG: hypothetical protein DRI99_07565 [Candidatus Aminicenantes bacterium]|nr:MAG: hypothetical protein DRI99_07565 [Candidatus Aminicenantes bacterium]RLE03783.1 MAG: hypothetical protein DRJ11_03175 [Candidatus Aminicenantes bacterium]